MKAVITSGGKQYTVAKGDVLDVELIKSDKKTVSFDVQMIVDGDKSKIGSPTVSGASVTAEIVENKRADKVTAIRYKAKKRVNKQRGHKQPLTTVKITSIKA